MSIFSAATDFLFGPLTARANNVFLGYSKTPKKKPGPLYGYKKVHLTWHRGKIGFESPSYHTKFGVMAQAECGNHMNHAKNFNANKDTHTIDLNCTCGFYSYKTPAEAYSYPDDGASPGYVIQTVNSGLYMEYQQGYRAEKQRVTKVFVGNCDLCLAKGKKSKSVAVARLIGFAGVDSTLNRLYGVCDSHAKTISRRRLYTFDELGAHIGVPVGYAHKPVMFESVWPEITPLEAADIKRKTGRIFAPGSSFKDGVLSSDILASIGMLIVALAMVSMMVALFASVMIAALS